MRFIGRSVKMNRLRIYVISSIFGALMAGVDSSIHTDMLFWTTSGEAILMSVLGGINQFFGPFIGAVVLILLENIIIIDKGYIVYSGTTEDFKQKTDLQKKYLSV